MDGLKLFPVEPHDADVYRRIYVVCFLNSLVGTVVLCLTPHVMSDFSGHSILSVLPMVVRVVSGVLRLPIAKFIDEFGRAHGFLMASGLTILGLFIQALAQSLTETIVAQTLYGIGSNCMDYVLTVIVADMTSLKNRSMLVFTPPSPRPLKNSFQQHNSIPRSLHLKGE